MNSIIKHSLLFALIIFCHAVHKCTASHHESFVKSSLNDQRPTAKEYDNAGEEGETETRKVVKIQHGSAEGLDPPKGTTPVDLKCNSTTKMTKVGDWYQIQSDNFGSASKSYKPGSSCSWHVQGVSQICVPAIKCDKVDIRYVKGEELVIQDHGNRKIILTAGDHFHSLKKASDEKGLDITFRMGISKKFKKRHYDGFNCLLTCVTEICPEKLDPLMCISSTPGSHCPNPVPEYDCEEPHPIIKLDSKPQGACKQVPVIEVPLVEGGKPIQLNLTIKLLNKPALDFYFLIDASSSFIPGLKILAKNAKKLVNVIKGLSPEAAIGYGTFVDKDATTSAASRTAFTAYSFRNNFGLNSQEDAAVGLQAAIENTGEAKFSKGVTNYWEEDSLTGLHQAVYCTNEIGWRSNSKKMIFIAVDGKYNTNMTGGDLLNYAAFDPKRCYLGPDGIFPGTGVNYPKPEDVQLTIQDAGVYVIVAIYDNSKHTTPGFAIWRKFVNGLTPKGVDTKFTDFAKIEALIKSQYQKCVDKSQPFVLVQNSTNEYLKFDFHSADRRAIICDKPHAGTVKGERLINCSFNVTLDACPKDGSKSETLAFNVEGYQKMADFDFKFICKENNWGTLSSGL